ncbi:hypothetical protein ACROYT_G031237 [Oculina patagonica]
MISWAVPRIVILLLAAMVQGTKITVPTYLTLHIPCPDQCRCIFTWFDPDKIVCRKKNLTSILQALPASITLLALYMYQLETLPHEVFNNNTKLRSL